MVDGRHRFAGSSMTPIMLNVLGPTRRCFLRACPLGLLAAARPAAEASFGRAKRCLVLFLTGGPPQHDTFDPKPDAPAEIRGPFKSIDTNVPGIRLAELC